MLASRLQGGPGLHERIYFWEFIGLTAWLGSIVFIAGASFHRRRSRRSALQHP